MELTDLPLSVLLYSHKDKTDVSPFEPQYMLTSYSSYKRVINKLSKLKDHELREMFLYVYAKISHAICINRKLHCFKSA